MRRTFAASPSTVALAGVIALVASGCGGSSSPPPEAAEPATSAVPAADDAAAQAAAREQELAAKEAELALREREAELARREVEIAEREAAAAAAAARPAATSKPAATTKPVAAAKPEAKPAPAAPAAPPAPVQVAAGTPLKVQLESAISTKTATLGQPFEARLVSDLVVNGRRVAPAGAPVRGTVSELVSGSKKIGSTPKLRLQFEQLALADGSTQAISGRLTRKATSDQGKDAAKIVGGTAAGAVIGHQVDDDKGAVIGGVLGGAAGTIAAQKTGGEVEFAAGEAIEFTLASGFEYRGK